MSAERFRFLNVERDVSARSAWNDADSEKLWLYNLHYFDVLSAHDATAARSQNIALIFRWIADNPPVSGTGWEPYPTSLRIVNWIKWALAGNDLPHAALDSLATQCRYLHRRIEWHLLGNHLLANAKALVFGGLFFAGSEADAWLSKGLSILAAEIPEQVLADGGHFERSPMYHSIILEDALDLVNVLRAYSGAIESHRRTIDALSARIPAMLQWLDAMSHDDGRISFFNDGAFDIAAEPAALREYAERLGYHMNARADEANAIAVLPQSGYVRAKSGAFTVIFDAAPVGPDYLPGHAHADTLSFELSYRGQRVITNSGTSCYGAGATRLWERSTAAHNTVEVDGQDSSEVWSGFRVARRAKPLGLTASRDAESLRLHCAHDGYTRLRGAPRHQRAIYVAEHAVTWADEIIGKGRHEVIGRIPIHPDVEVSMASEMCVRLRLPNGSELELSNDSGHALGIEEGWYAPAFGVRIRRPVIRWQASVALPLTARFTLRGLS